MTASTPGDPGQFRLQAELLGAMPIIDTYLARLKVADLLGAFISGDRRMKLRPAKALGVVVRNLVLHREPVYALEEWAAPFDPAVLGLDASQVHLLNDDRVGGALLSLFDADRASLLNKLVLGAVDEFSIDCSQLHNDSTSVKLTGVYATATGVTRGAKPTIAAKRGHSKDHRPDLLQLVFILTVTADGAVPVACRTTDGNVEDSTTHIATWDGLVALLGRSDFLYVADSKLATRENMAHIVKHHGRFVSVLPASLPRRTVPSAATWLTMSPPGPRRCGEHAVSASPTMSTRRPRHPGPALRATGWCGCVRRPSASVMPSPDRAASPRASSPSIC